MQISQAWMEVQAISVLSERLDRAYAGASGSASISLTIVREGARVSSPEGLRLSLTTAPDPQSLM
jgi:hypothetical protein